MKRLIERHIAAATNLSCLFVNLANNGIGAFLWTFMKINAL